MSDLTPQYFAAVLAHVNDDHSAELLAAIHAQGTTWATAAELCRLDETGLSVQASNQGHSEELNLVFSKTAQDSAELRQQIMSLMHRGETLLETNPLPTYDPAALEKIIQARRSYPLDKLDSRPVPREMLERCINAARFAPNHGRTHPFRFAVVTGQEARTELLTRCLYALKELEMPASYEKIYREIIFEAPAWIAIGMKPRLEHPMPEWEELAAVSMAAQNLHLMAQAQGLGALWVSGKVVIHQVVADYFGWGQSPDKCLGLYWLGFVKHTLKPRSYPSLEELVSWKEF